MMSVQVMENWALIRPINSSGKGIYNTNSTYCRALNVGNIPTTARYPPQ